MAFLAILVIKIFILDDHSLYLFRLFHQGWEAFFVRSKTKNEDIFFPRDPKPTLVGALKAPCGFLCDPPTFYGYFSWIII